MATRSRFEWNTLKDVLEVLPLGDDDSVEVGDGRNSRHQVFAVQLLQAIRDSRVVFFGSFTSTIDFNPSTEIAFTFEGANGAERVTITRNNLDKIYDRLTLRKREVIRVNGQNVLSIKFEKVVNED